MDFHDFPRFLGKSGMDLMHPLKLCASLVSAVLRLYELVLTADVDRSPQFYSSQADVRPARSGESLILE